MQVPGTWVGVRIGPHALTWHWGRVERQEIGSVLVVRDGRVARFARHPDLGAALHAAGLGPADEVGPG
jgi:hypothetical protein